MAVHAIKWERNNGQDYATTSHDPDSYYSDLENDAAGYAIGWRAPNYPVPAPYALYGGKLLPIVTVNIHGDNVFCGLAYMTADGMTLAYCR